MPSWSPDGQWIYYIRTRYGEGRWPVSGATATVRPARSRPDARPGRRQRRARAARDRPVQAGQLHVVLLDAPAGGLARRQDDRDGHRRARTPTSSNVVLQFFDTTTKKIKRAGVAETGLLGHQDPEWRPDGKYLLYVKNGRDGTPRHAGHRPYDPATKKTKAHHDVGLPEPVLLAGRAVHRRHQDLEPRDGRRDPRRHERPRAAPGHRRRQLVRARPGRPPATASPSSTSTARPSTSGSPARRRRPVLDDQARRSR